MENVIRIGSRMTGLILSVVTYFFFELKYLGAGICFFAFIFPLSFYPLSLLLQKIGKSLARSLSQPLIILIFISFFVPYGIIYKLVVRKKLHIYEHQSLKKLHFDSEF